MSSVESVTGAGAQQVAKPVAKPVVKETKRSRRGQKRRNNRRNNRRKNLSQSSVNDLNSAEQKSVIEVHKNAEPADDIEFGGCHVYQGKQASKELGMISQSPGTCLSRFISTTTLRRI
jgi:hypothetical protein